MLQIYRNTLMITIQKNVSRVMRKPAFCICGNKRRRSAAQLLRSGSTHVLSLQRQHNSLLLCTARFVEPEDRFSHDDATMHENVSRLMIKPAFCICENRGAGQLRSNCAADQRLCFRYKDSTIPLHYEQPGLCRTWSGTLKTGFLTTMLISYKSCLYHKNLEYRFL